MSFFRSNPSWRPEGMDEERWNQLQNGLLHDHKATDTEPSEQAIRNTHTVAGQPPDALELWKEYQKAGKPGLTFRLGRASAYATEGCLVLLAYTNLNDALHNAGWGPPPKSPRPFIINSIPGKGMGMVASKNIKAGDLIHKERLIFATPQAQLGVRGEMTIQVMEKQVETALDLLPRRLRDQFLALSNSKPEDEWLPKSGIVMTNSIGVRFNQVNALGLYSAVFPEISRVNHSCCPNAEYGRFDSNLATIELRASHDIKKDAEITIGYTGTLSSRGARRDTLFNCYGFLCSCESCSLPVKKSQESDKRRALIVSRSAAFDRDPYCEDHLNTWIENCSLADNYLISRHLEALVTLEREKQTTNRPEHCGVIAACYAALGDEENTKKWCAKADTMCQADIRDPNTELENIWTNYQDSPRDHPLWGYRVKDKPRP